MASPLRTKCPKCSHFVMPVAGHLSHEPETGDIWACPYCALAFKCILSGTLNDDPLTDADIMLLPEDERKMVEINLKFCDMCRRVRGTEYTHEDLNRIANAFSSVLSVSISDIRDRLSILDVIKQTDVDWLMVNASIRQLAVILFCALAPGKLPPGKVANAGNRIAELAKEIAAENGHEMDSTEIDMSMDLSDFNGAEDGAAGVGESDEPEPPKPPTKPRRWKIEDAP